MARSTTSTPQVTNGRQNRDLPDTLPDTLPTSARLSSPEIPSKPIYIASPRPYAVPSWYADRISDFVTGLISAPLSPFPLRIFCLGRIVGLFLWTWKVKFMSEAQLRRTLWAASYMLEI